MTERAADAAARVVAGLTAAGRTVAVAESLTGGAVVEALVAVPGASACVRGGVVAYATDLKASLLGVPTALLDAVGPVDPEVALAMARGVRDTHSTMKVDVMHGLFQSDPGVRTELLMRLVQR